MEAHTITHIEIPAPDLEAAVSFYGKIFNWKIETVQEGMYAFFKTSERSGGAFDAALKPAEEKTGIQIVIDVEDIEKKLEEIEEAGGSIVLAKTEIEGGHGFYACFRDPNENYMQLHSRK